MKNDVKYEKCINVQLFTLISYYTNDLNFFVQKKIQPHNLVWDTIFYLVIMKVWKRQRVYKTTFSTKLWKENNDSQNRQKVICFSCIQITYSYIFYYFTRHDILKNTRCPNLFIVPSLLTHSSYHGGNALDPKICNWV